MPKLILPLGKQPAVDVSTDGQQNRYCYDPNRCNSNEQDDKYEVTPDSGQMLQVAK